MTLVSALVVLLDSHETSELSVRARVGLEGNAVILSDRNQIVFEFFNHLQVARHLVSRGKWMDRGESVPGDGDHGDGRVELKGTRSERDHGFGEADIFVS